MEIQAGGHLSELFIAAFLLIAPWLAIILTDFVYNRVGNRASSWAAWPGILSFALGVAVSIPFMSSTLYMEPLAKNLLNGTDISYFISTIISVFTYLGYMKFKPAGVKSANDRGTNQQLPYCTSADSEVI